MRLVHNDQIPARLLQPKEDLVALRQVERGDDPAAVHPLVDAVLGAQLGALQHDEALVGLLAQLPLPLERQVGRRGDQDAFGQAAQLELAVGVVAEGTVGRSQLGELRVVERDLPKELGPRSDKPEFPATEAVARRGHYAHGSVN